MAKARMIIAISNDSLLMMLVPNKGRLVQKSGSRAQCMAQISEALTPRASKLILNLIKSAKIAKKQHSCKILVRIRLNFAWPIKSEFIHHV
jgi:hypothetical protein